VDTKLKKVVISLEPEEVIRLMRTALDEDPAEAFALVMDCLYPRVMKELEKTQCMPFYELEARRRDGANEDNPWLKKKK